MKHQLDFVTNRDFHPVFYNFCYLVLSLETYVYITFSLSLFEFILIPSFGTRLQRGDQTEHSKFE